MLEYFKSQAFLETVIVLIFALIILVIVKKIEDKYLNSENRNKSWYMAAINIKRTVLAILFLLIAATIMSINGIRLGRYVAGLGVVGAVASFALQDPIKDIIMGMTILFEGYYKVGDIIIYDDIYAKVININARSTKLFDIDRECIITVSNRNISEVAIASDWIDINVPIGYDQDLNVSRTICRECARRIERLRYVYSCDFLNTQELAPSWIEYKLRIHCLTEKRTPVKRNALAVVQDVFYEHNMEFPVEVKILYDAGKMEKPDVKFPEKGTEEISRRSAAKKKYDYELGRGAAKSKVCKMDSSTECTKKALHEVERYMAAENIHKKMSDRVRLLTEEVIALTNSMTDVTNGELFIERNGVDYEICYKADAIINKDARQKLTSISSSGSNAAYNGIAGVLNRAIDSMVYMGTNIKKIESENIMDKSIIKSDEDTRWSFNAFKEKFASEKKGTSEDMDKNLGDEFEQSLLTMLSDDIKISVRANQVNIRVLVKNWTDNE